MRTVAMDLLEAKLEAAENIHPLVTAATAAVNRLADFVESLPAEVREDIVNGIR